MFGLFKKRLDGRAILLITQQIQMLNSWLRRTQGVSISKNKVRFFATKLLERDGCKVDEGSIGFITMSVVASNDAEDDALCDEIGFAQYAQQFLDGINVNVSEIKTLG